MSSITITEHNRLLPEFSLEGKVIVVTGGARGLGLTQADVLIEAGAIGNIFLSPRDILLLTLLRPNTVHVLDVLPAPSSDFSRICSKATTLGTSLTYHIADVRSPSSLSDTISRIGKIDGLIAAAGVQKETPALLYSAPDANAMLEVNVTGVFLTAQAVAREMIARKTTGSIVLVASMSGRIANKVVSFPFCSTLSNSHSFTLSL
jgi:NAD(P)-dependent dehydrogenase (short-subunit alcohol dehydrogenase family)